MGIVLDNLYEASFKGAIFFFTGGDTTGGRKTVTHEYPNKDFRLVEDLGERLPTFSIRGIITGGDYEFTKRTLINALTEKGIGTLRHPFFGNLQCVATGFTVTENMRKVGTAEFSMNFSQADQSLFPNSSRNNLSEIADLFTEIYRDAPRFLNDNYRTSSTANISASSQTLLALSARLVKIANNLPLIQVSGTNFIQEILSFNNNSFKIAGGNDIGGNLTTLIAAFDNLSQDSQSRFDAVRSLSGFGSGDEFLDINTFDINERTTNTQFTNGTVNGLGFITMSDAAKNIEYNNEEDLNETTTIIDDVYDQLVESTTNKFSTDFLDEINEMRNELRIFFDQERVIVNKVLIVESRPIPATILTYSYYGNTDEYTNIVALNNFTNPAVVSGNIKILEQ